MKKRIKITLRTKIYLTIAGLMALTGILYAANPVTFSTFQSLTSVAATKTELFATGYFGNTGVYTLDNLGLATMYQAAPGGEKYMAIAPAQSTATGFTPRDVFLTFGPFIYKATPPGPFTFFTQVPCGSGETDHTGITFDHVGTFGFNMIVTCQGGDVFKIDNLPGGPHATLLASVANGDIEGPAVAPLSFGPLGGQVLVADENANQIDAIDALGNISLNVFNTHGQVTPEGVAFVPDPMCTYAGFAFFQTSQQSLNGTPSLFAYAPADFAGLAGSAIIPLEQAQAIALVQYTGGNYVLSVFDNPPGFNVLEGFAFVDCDVPTPTPTPTPTATSTPTATFTPTATATATFTPTPTATFTPTPTATFTPTPTATFTPTPTATFTPTPTATFTPTPTATFTPTPTATFTPTPTPTPTPAQRRSQITPTGTTCNQFVNGTAQTLANLNYSVSQGKIGQNVTPGVFFYWVAVTVPAGNNSFTITETMSNPPGNFSTPFLLGGGSNVFNSSCGSVSETITQNTTTGTVTVSFNAPVAGTYNISLKFNSKSVAGVTAPNPTTVHYAFAITGDPGSTQGLDLIKN